MIVCDMPHKSGIHVASRDVGTPVSSPSGRTYMRPRGMSTLPINGVLTPDLIAAMQRTAGNRGVAYLLGTHARECQRQKSILRIEAEQGQLIQNIMNQGSTSNYNGSKKADVNVQRTAKFTQYGHDIPPEVVSTWLQEQIAELGESIPSDWWIDKNDKNAGLDVDSIKRALYGLAGATEDYGEFNLDTQEGVTALCRALIRFSLAQRTISHTLEEELSPPSTTALTPSKNYSSTSDATEEEEEGHQAKKQRQSGNTKEELSSLSTTALTPNIPVPPLITVGREAQPQQRMEAKFLTRENYSRIHDTLKKWEKYAETQSKLLLAAYSELKEQRDELGDDYYSSRQRDFREKFKKVRDRRVHMGGALSECFTICASMTQAYLRKEDLGRFAALYADEQLQGIVEWKSRDADEIANIAGNPYNIVPAKEGDPVVKGVARALLILTVAQHRAHRAQSTIATIKLDALNNKVKGIYDRYYFRVTSEGRMVERLPRGTTVADDEKKSKRPKTEWHSTKTMILTDEMAKKLIDETEPKKWLTAPEELANYLDNFKSGVHSQSQH